MDIPDDFDSFWADTAAEAAAVPLDFRRSRRREFEYLDFVVEKVWFSSVDGRTVEGWISYETGAQSAPGFVWIPPYGRESLLPNAYGTRSGMVSLSLNLHGHGAFHQETYTPSRGYFAEGAEDPESWIFRRIFQDCYIAARVLQAQFEVDENRIGCMGMSQGAGLSIWMGAHCPIIKAVASDMPFLGTMNETLSRNAYRYPLKELIDFMETIPLGRERVLHTISYFDTLHQATRCQVPTHVSLGLKDPACRPETVRAIFEALTGKKVLAEYDWGHDWHPSMIDANRDWLLGNL